MRSLLLSAFILSLFCFNGVQSIQLDYQYEFLGLGDTIFIQGQNLSFILGNGVYLNLWNNTLIDISNTSACTNTTNIVLTTNQSAFCLKLGEKNYLNHIQPSNAQVIQQFLYTGNNLGDLMIYGDYVIFTSKDQNVFSVDVFDTKRSQFYCHVPPIDLEASVQDVFVTGDNVILAQGSLRPPYHASLLFISCYEDTVIKTPFNSQLSNLQAYNGTSVFVTGTWNDTYMNEILPFYFDLSGQARFGTAKPLILDSYQYNDTFILASDSENFNENDYNLFYINNFLAPVKSQNLPTGISAFVDVFSFLTNDSSLLMADQGATFLYNFETQNITHSWSSYPPITLGNGSVLNFSDANGYLIQSPGEPIYYIFSPYATPYYSSDFNNVWLFYNPAYGEFRGYPNCTLTHIEINTSTITKHYLKKCTCDLSQETPPIIEIFNITTDSNGLPTIVYICSDNFMGAIIANTTQEITEVPLGYGHYPIVTSNLEAGIVNMGYLNYNLNEFVIQKYNVSTTNPIGNVTRIPNIDFYKTKVTTTPDGNFIIASSNSNGTKFHIFDVNTYTVVKTINSPGLQLQYNGLSTTNFYVLGYNNSTSFGGFIYTDGTNAYAISSTGNSTIAPIDFNVMLNVLPASDDSFYVYGMDSSFAVSHIAYFEVAAW